MPPPFPALTDEQLAVVHHDPQRHATVLAVAGSGKTTAMVVRIGHLIADLGVPARSIRAVMFNRAARRDFEQKLEARGITGVRVQTFNALGHAIVGWGARQGLCEPLALMDDTEALRMVERIIGHRRRTVGFDGDPIDGDEALAAIRTWKGQLTPPDEARCTARPALVEIYRLFEEARQKAGRMTFDDQIGEAVRLIETSPMAQRSLVDRIDHLIIDEFQDVNHAQQRLAQLIAGQRARVMVVGDDDQCIYEWRGARSAYIKTVFKDTFDHHAHSTYRLTRSFRFGPVIARVAANAIAQNTDRVRKDLIAADPLAGGAIELLGPEADLVAHIKGLIAQGARPDEMVVLVRLFAQSYPLQARLIAEELPFVVEGERSLLESAPVRALRAYLDLAVHVNAPLDSERVVTLEHIVDKPTRYVRKQSFSRVLHRALARDRTVGDVLADGFSFQASGITARAADALFDLTETLHKAHDAGIEGGAVAAARAIVDDVDLGEWLAEWQSEERVEAGRAMLDAFVALLEARQVPLDGVETFAKDYDTRRGQPVDACLRITSIFRAKGLEWDHVFLPDVREGTCPHLGSGDVDVDNLLRPELAVPPTEPIEAERRLFYVAVTRARRSVTITGHPLDADECSRFLDDALLMETRRAVDTAVGVARAGAASPRAIDALRGVATHSPIKSALPGLLDRLAERLPDAVPALDRVRAAIDEVEAAPRVAPKRRPLASGPSGLPF